MTEDQYGQARGPGYAARGEAVPEDEEAETTEQSRPMTRFQKVASALLGDRQDRDEQAQDEGARDRTTTGNRATAGSQAAAESDVMEPASGTPAAESDVMEPASGTPAASPTWTPVSNADEAAAASSPAAQDAPVTRPGESAATAGAPRDYWDDPGEPASGQEGPVAATMPDVPVTDAGADPLTRQDEMAGQAGTAAGGPATEPDLYGTARSGRGTAQAPDGDAAGAATIADIPAADAAAGATGTAAGSTGRAAGAPGTTEDTAGAEGGAPGTAAGTRGTMADRAGATAGPAAGMAAGAGADAGSAADAAGGTTGRHAAGPPDGESRPGALGDFSDLTYGNLIPDADQFMAQWQQIQFRFVDDPQGSVTEAAEVVAQVTARLEAAIQDRQRAVEERQRAIQDQQRSLRGRWGEGTNADTEALRETLRMYHVFLEQLIGARTS